MNDMRLGDLDALESKFSGEDCLNATIRRIIAEEPTIEAEIVVRCKDCVHFRDYTDRHGFVRMLCIREKHLPNVEPEHFCSYGERKGGE